jgi:hypothetical protein
VSPFAVALLSGGEQVAQGRGREGRLHVELPALVTETAHHPEFRRDQEQDRKHASPNSELPDLPCVRICFHAASLAPPPAEVLIDKPGGSIGLTDERFVKAAHGSLASWQSL